MKKSGLRILSTIFIVGVVSSLSVSTVVKAEVNKDYNIEEDVLVSPRETGAFRITNSSGAYVRSAPYLEQSPTYWFPKGTTLWRYYRDPVWYNSNKWYYVMNVDGVVLGYVLASDGVPE